MPWDCEAFSAVTPEPEEKTPVPGTGVERK
jgi:hypothetical protein